MPGAKVVDKREVGLRARGFIPRARTSAVYVCRADSQIGGLPELGAKARIGVVIIARGSDDMRLAHSGIEVWLLIALLCDDIYHPAACAIAIHHCAPAGQNLDRFYGVRRESV